MSFLKGFMSLFDWMNPRSYDEISDELDINLQDFYEKNGWGVYRNPLKDYEPCKFAETQRINHENLEKLIKDFEEKKSEFNPYAEYIEGLGIKAYWKDHHCEVRRLNKNIEIHVSQETGEIAGVTILNVEQLLKEKK